MTHPVWKIKTVPKTLLRLVCQQTKLNITFRFVFMLKFTEIINQRLINILRCLYRQCSSTKRQSFMISCIASFNVVFTSNFDIVLILWFYIVSREFEMLISKIHSVKSFQKFFSAKPALLRKKTKHESSMFVAVKLRKHSKLCINKTTFIYSFLLTDRSKVTSFF